MTSHQKGYIAEQKVKLHAIEIGWNAAKPEMEARYDLILDDQSRLYRVQVKFVDTWMGNALHIDLRKECRNNGIKKRYTQKEIDAVAVYCPRMDELLWIPAVIVDGKTTLNLRIHETKNGQKRGVRYVRDFIWVDSSIGRATVS